MGLGKRKSQPSAQEQRAAFWNLAGIPGLISASAYGMSTEIDQALRNAASFACIDVLADAVSRTPMNAVRGAGRVVQVVEPQPQILAKPSPIIGKSAWRYQQAWSIVTDGNAFAGIGSMSSLGYPTQAEMIDPLTVLERQVVNGIPQVKIGRDVHQLYPFGDIWHVPGRMIAAGSPFGISPIHYANKTIGTSLAVEDFSFDYFAKGAHPSAIVYANASITEEQAKAIKQAVTAAMSSREIGVLGADLKYEQMQTPAGETQFIELLRFGVEQACRFWRVPPSMVYSAISGQSVTYTNASDADLAFLKHTLDGYLVRIEEAWTDVLPKPQTVQADRNSVLRMDVQGRYNAQKTALEMRAATVNEVRAEEGKAPFPGDEFNTPGIPPYPGAVGPTSVSLKSADPESNVRSVEVFAVMPDQAPQPAPVINVHVPEQRQSLAPVINVSPTPIVNQVNPTPVQVDVSPTPVTVENRFAPNVQPAPVTVIEASDGTEEVTFKRDDKGRIISAKKKPV